MKPIFYACMVTVVVVSACSSGKTTFERGNYYEAVITSVNRLRKNSDHKKSIETLRQAYPMAVSFYDDRAKTALASAQPFKWSQVVNSYTTINHMYDEIKRCPGALRVIPDPTNYFSKLQEARQNAAEEHYAAGIGALQFNEREKAKQAYGHFKTSNEFVAGYKDVVSYMEAALNAATVKVLVEPIPVQSKSVGVSAEFFNDKISEFVHSAPINEFVRFYSRKEAETIKLKPDHIIQLQFDDFTVGQVHKHEKEIHLTKDSIVMATYVTPSTASQPSSTITPTTDGKSGLVMTKGSGIVASTQSPVGARTVTEPSENPETAAEKAARERAEKERAAQQLAEQQRAEQMAREKALADKLRAEQEAAEKALAEREAAAKTLAEKERLEKERAALEAEKARLEKEIAERDAAEKARLEKERAEREAAEKARLERERVEREAAEKTRLEKEKAEREAAEKARLEKEKAEREAAEKARLEKEKAEREAAEKARLEKERAEREAAEKARLEKERAEREAAEKTRLEKEKAEREAVERARIEKEKADRERAEKDKSEKATYVDDTIKPSDTLNVKDPVTICHIPPGNNSNRQTLTISRAALKAHLAHGDIEGDCNEEKKDQKGSPPDNGKGKTPEGEKANPKTENKGKGPGANNRVRTPESNHETHALLYTPETIMFASADENPGQWLRYFTTDADTNKVYGTVKATLYHNTKTTTAKGVVSFRIIDAKTGALLSTEKMPGEFVWVSEWATFNGDERALSADQIKLTRLKEQPAPAPQDLFIEFTRPIYDQITVKIREFYKGY